MPSLFLYIALFSIASVSSSVLATTSTTKSPSPSPSSTLGSSSPTQPSYPPNGVHFNDFQSVAVLLGVQGEARDVLQAIVNAFTDTTHTPAVAGDAVLEKFKGKESTVLSVLKSIRANYNSLEFDGASSRFSQLFARIQHAVSSSDGPLVRSVEAFRRSGLPHFTRQRSQDMSQDVSHDMSHVSPRWKSLSLSHPPSELFPALGSFHLGRLSPSALDASARPSLPFRLPDSPSDVEAADSRLGFRLVRPAFGRDEGILRNVLQQQAGPLAGGPRIAAGGLAALGGGLPTSLGSWMRGNRQQQLPLLVSDWMGRMTSGQEGIPSALEHANSLDREGALTRSDGSTFPLLRATEGVERGGTGARAILRNTAHGKFNNDNAGDSTPHLKMFSIIRSNDQAASERVPSESGRSRGAVQDYILSFLGPRTMPGGNGKEGDEAPAKAFKVTGARTTDSNDDRQRLMHHLLSRGSDGGRKESSSEPGSLLHPLDWRSYLKNLYVR